MKVIYLIGSLRNPDVPLIAQNLREWGYEAFDDWWSASEDADEWWQQHERLKGRTYSEAINGYHAQNVFEFDKRHLDRADAGVLVMPAGRSGHLELGYLVGNGKPCFVLFDKEPDRFDIMYRFAKAVCFTNNELKEALSKYV